MLRPVLKHRRFQASCPESIFPTLPLSLLTRFVSRVHSLPLIYSPLRRSFLSRVLTLGPSGLRDIVLTLCMKSHLSQLEAFCFCLALVHTHTRTHISHNTDYLPDLISSVRLSKTDVSDRSIQNKHFALQQLSHTELHVIVPMNTYQHASETSK